MRHGPSPRPAGRRGVAAGLVAAALAGSLVAAPVRAGTDDVYAYVDAGGVIHYTNVPHDGRYHLIARAIASGAADAAAARAAGRPAVRTRTRVARRVTSDYDRHIRAAAQKYGVAAPLLKAVMAAESNFDPAAVSPKGARGLMQLMPGTARELLVDDVFDPAQNIEAGARYLRRLQDRFAGDLELVLAAYNAGPARVGRASGRIPEVAETRAYVRRVLELYRQYASLR